LRTPLVVGNWKMNQNLAEVESFFKEFQVESYADNVQFGICPVSLHMSKALEFKTSSVLIGSQDNHFNESGAHTGDISAKMLKELGAALAVTGHSERRADHNESSELVAKKTRTAIDAGLIAIVCVGETLEQREADQTQAVVEDQLRKSLTGISAEDSSQLVIAYEPVWAIGTGKTASPEQRRSVSCHTYFIWRLCQTC
jgi:triosephosphate isomerase